MNNTRCCNTCENRVDRILRCPFDYRDGRLVPNGWNDNENYCNEYTPKPEAPGKIEPLVLNYAPPDHVVLSVVMNKINEIIDALNGRG
jgi:hypothetical protein